MKRVAIVNRTNLKNYGSVLQTYALCSAVEMLGYDAEIIWESGNLSTNYDFRPYKVFATGLKLLLNPSLFKSTYSNVKYVQQHIISERTVQLFDEFVEKHIKRRFYNGKQMTQKVVGQKYDKFICGSDQVWCTTSLYVDPLMYLRFAPKNKRIAYAPSLGRDYIPDYNRKQIKKYINEIPSVSVREVMGQKLIAELTGRSVPVVLDPTLLVGRSFWDEKKESVQESGGYVLCYFLSTPTKETQEKLLKFIGQGKRIIALNSRLEHLDNELEVQYPDCGPAQFISFIEHADTVFTDSYHGMLFSLMYRKEFWSIAREYGEFDQSSRQLSVLNMLGLNRYCNIESEWAQEPIDYHAVDDILNREKEKSLEYLRKALER